MSHQDTPKGWYSRGYLPHFDCPGLVQAVTFRLADSLPTEVLAKLEEQQQTEPNTELIKRRFIEAYLDSGYGACSLREERIAQLVESALLAFDGKRYRLLAWVVMPNHVHVLIETLPNFRLPDIVHSWKSFTSNQINQMLGQRGRFWQAEYFDRYIRDETHLERVRAYIHENPVKAQLTTTAEAWQWSSASRLNDQGTTQRVPEACGPREERP